MPANNKNTITPTLEALPRDIRTYLFSILPKNALSMLAKSSHFWNLTVNQYVTQKPELEFQIKQRNKYSAESLFIELLMEGKYSYSSDQKNISDIQKQDNALEMLTYLVKTKKISNINDNFKYDSNRFAAIHFASQHKPNKNYFRLFEFLLKNGAQIARRQSKTITEIFDIFWKTPPTGSPQSLWISGLKTLDAKTQVLICIYHIEAIFKNNFDSDNGVLEDLIKISIHYDKEFFLEYYKNIIQTKKGYQITYTEKNIEFLDDLLKTILPLESPMDTTPGLAQ